MAQVTTTLKVFWELLYQHMQTTLEGTVGEESGVAITQVAEGEVTPGQYTIPFVVVQLINFEAEQRTGEAKLWVGKVKFKIVSVQHSALRPTVEIMDKIAQVQEAIDTFVRPAGATGLEDGEWSVTYPSTPNTGDLIIAEHVATFSINVER